MNYADFQFLKFDHKPNGVLVITINRPEVMNATNGRLHWELTKIWGVVTDDAKTKVAVITGAGDQAFSAGGDLEWVAGMVGNPKEIANTMTEASDVVYNMMACDKPIISAINAWPSVPVWQSPSWPTSASWPRRPRLPTAMSRSASPPATTQPFCGRCCAAWPRPSTT